MKKKIVTAIIAAAMVLSLASCGTKNADSSGKTPASSPVTEAENTVSTEKEPETVSSDPGDTEVFDDDTLDSIYADVLKDGFNIIYYNMQSEYDSYYSVAEEVRYMNDEEKAKIGYCYDDINKDGIKECIVGYGSNLYSIFSYDADTYAYYNLYYGGYRSFLAVLEDGTVVDGGSSGAAYYSTRFSTFDSKGNITVKDFYFTDTDASFENVLYFHNQTGDWEPSLSEAISEEDFKAADEYPANVVDYTEAYKSFTTIADECGGFGKAVSYEDLIHTGWSLENYREDGVWYDVLGSGDNVTLIFDEDKNVTYVVYRHGEEAFTVTEPVEIYEDLGEIGFFYDDPEHDARVYVNVARILDDGTLFVQSSWFKNDTDGLTGGITDGISSEHFSYGYFKAGQG